MRPKLWTDPETPLAELREIEEAVKRLKRYYPDVFDDPKIVFTGLIPLQAIGDFWAEAERRSDRLFLDPKRYTFDPARPPMVLDIGHMKRLDLQKIKHENAVVRVFYGV